MQNKEELIYSGIPTFMGSDFIKEDDIKKYDVVFLGVPTDYGASYRLGAKYAPRQLREYSFWDRVDGLKMYDLDNEQYIQTNNLNIADIGDIEVNPTNPEQNQCNITDKVYSIRKNSFPVICGGDHCITYGSFRGCYKAIKEMYQDYEIGIIHYDAHMDVEKDYLNMPRIWHGNVFRKLIEDGFLKGENLYTIGPRGIINSEDMSYIFGTGTPKSNGLSVCDCEKSLRKLKKLDTVGFDIVELNPKLDDSHSSFVIACELLYDFLAFAFNGGNN